MDHDRWWNVIVFVVFAREETMRAHPEIREGVRREKERMIEERDRMSLEQNQDSNVTAPWGDGDDSTLNSSGNDDNSDDAHTQMTMTTITTTIAHLVLLLPLLILLVDGELLQSEH